MARHADRLDLLGTFARIAERGSISAAARDLDISQAAASRRLARLEAELAMPLVLRDTHTLSLTDAGRAVLDTARDMDGRWAELQARLQGDGQLSGRLRVVAPVALGQLRLTGPMLAFCEAHPRVTVDWSLRDGSVDMLGEGVDLWIRIGDPGDDRLVVSDLARVERLVVGAPAFGELLGPQALESAPFLALGPFEGGRIPLHGKSDRVEVEARVVLRTDNIFALREAALRGRGYAVLPRWMVADDLARGKLLDSLPSWRAPELSVTAAYLPRQRGTARLQAFRDHMAEALLDLA